MFSVKHLIILGISIAVFVEAMFLIKKISLKQTFKIMLWIGIVSEVIKVFYYIMTNEATLGGYLPKTDLPFHLCSLQIILVLIVNISKNENLKRLIMSFMMPTCLIGGFAAIMIPTSSSINGLWILSIQYFAYHTALMILAIKIMKSEELNLSIKDYKNCLIMLGAIGMFAIYLNSIVNDYVHNINFMYVVNPPQSGLPYLNKNHGWFVYIVHYAFLALFAITMCYIKPIVNAIKSKKVQKAENN